MPPQLALILTLILIFLLVRIEHEKAKLSGSSVWIIAAWMLHSASRGLGYYLNIQTTIEAGSPPDRYFLLFLAALCIFIIIKRHPPIKSFLTNNWTFFFIFLYMLISIIWANSPGITFRRWGRELIVILMSFLLLTENSPISVIFSAIKRFIYAAFPLSILLIKYFPSYGRQYGRWTGEVTWVGIAGQKNGLAMLCVFSLIFLLWSLWQDIKLWHRLQSRLPFFIDLIMTVIAIYLMIGPQRTLTYSATSFLALITGLIFMITLSLAIKKDIKLTRKIVIIGIAIIIAGTMMPFSGNIPIKKLPNILNRSETLTDRTEIWNILLLYAKKKIILGHGYGGFWTTTLREEIASHAHNGYLETVLNLGLVGLLLFSIFLIKTISMLATAIYENKFEYIPFLSIIFMYLVHNIAEATLGDFQSLIGIIIVLVSFIVSNRFLIENNI